MAPSIFIALFVQIWIKNVGPTSSMNFFNFVTMYAFVFLFLVASMELQENDTCRTQEHGIYN
jgi:hypothetical protein